MRRPHPSVRPSPGFRTAALAAWLLALPALGAGEAANDPLAERGVAVTGGAAPGYVDDRLCGRCHVDLYRSYQEVGMARSFYRPGPDNLIEDFDSDGFFHQPSRRHYRMLHRDGRLVMRRHQLDAAGEPVNVVEQPVDGRRKP